MDPLLPAIGGALWLGVLTSISPCPLATNIAAVSFLGRRVERSVLVLMAGLGYTLGRTVAYVALAAALVAGLVATPVLSRFLQTYMNQILGPVLIVTGMFLLELLRFPSRGGRIAEFAQARASRWGLWGAVPLGLLFALSFCPVSAALFFGSLIPLAVEHHSSVAIPLAYGIGTALPVVVFAVLIATGAGIVGRVFDKIASLEVWARRVTGLAFIVVGLYYVTVYVFI